MKKSACYRGLFYLIGLLVLAIGLALTTQVQLGVSPIISVAQAFSLLTGINFGDATLIWYTVFILVEVLLHAVGKNCRQIPLDLLQFPLSLVFTRFLNVFKAMIPDFAADLSESWLGTMPGRLVFLLIAIVFTGVGAALSMDVRLIPNPGDGIVQAISDAVKKPAGLVKNCVDISCVCISVILGLTLRGQLLGIGIGTVCAMILVGRVIAVFNHLFLEKLKRACGI